MENREPKNTQGVILWAPKGARPWVFRPQLKLLMPRRSARPQRYVNFCFTINNPDFSDTTDCGYSLPLWNEANMRYLCFGLEQGAEGTVHWQGYCELYHQMELPRIHTILYPGNQFHCERRLGTAEQAARYCLDQDETGRGFVYEFGTLSKQSERTALLDVRQRLEGGQSINDLVYLEPQIFHRYGRTAEKLAESIDIKRHRSQPTLGEWHWGPTGSGKSHTAFDRFNTETHYVKPWGKTETQWWDGYNGQDNVIFDEFRGQIPYEEILRLLDKWPLQVSRRGRPPVNFRSKRIIITSSKPPERVYRRTTADPYDSIGQLLRRIDIYEYWGFGLGSTKKPKEDWEATLVDIKEKQANEAREDAFRNTRCHGDEPRPSGQ